MTAAGLPRAWAEALKGLYTDELPEGEALPLELESIEAGARAQVSDPRVWAGLCAWYAHGVSFEESARQWNITRERMRQMQARAMRQLRSHALHAEWAARLAEWSERPRAVVISPQVEEVWPVLVQAAWSRSRAHLHTAQLAGDLWVLFQLDGGSRVRGADLPTGRFYTGAEAAAPLRLPENLLRVAWPVMNIRRLRNGRYAQREDAWTAAARLTAVACTLVEAGHDTWEERPLFAAVRSLPGVPDMQDSTLRLALRKHPSFDRTEVRGVWRWAGGPSDGDEHFSCGNENGV